MAEETTQAAKAALTDIQKDIGEWSGRNFGKTTIVGDLPVLLRLIQHISVIAHAMLKMSQNIRGDAAKHLDAISKEVPKAKESLAMFQFWSQTPNSGFSIQLAPLLGAVEEIGELLDALFDQSLSAEQRHELFVDGYADLLVFWLDFGARNGIDAESALNKTWEVVRARNWKKDKVSGGESS